MLSLFSLLSETTQWMGYVSSEHRYLANTREGFLISDPTNVPFKVTLLMMSTMADKILGNENH
jgi:hypothetical protein